jgi:hypothetical protein
MAPRFMGSAQSGHATCLARENGGPILPSLVVANIKAQSNHATFLIDMGLAPNTGLGLLEPLNRLPFPVLLILHIESGVAQSV